MTLAIILSLAGGGTHPCLIVLHEGSGDPDLNPSSQDFCLAKFIGTWSVEPSHALPASDSILRKQQKNAEFLGKTRKIRTDFLDPKIQIQRPKGLRNCFPTF